MLTFCLEYVQWPEFSANLPAHGNFKINPSFFKKFDFSSAAVFFPIALVLVPFLK